MDTSHFKGNFPESCSLEGCYVERDSRRELHAIEAAAWKEMLPRISLKANRRHIFGKLQRCGRSFACAIQYLS